MYLQIWYVKLDLHKGTNYFTSGTSFPLESYLVK